MGLTVIAGILMCLFAIVVATIMDGNSFGPLIGPSSFVLVLGCSVGASMIPFELSEVLGLPKAILKSFKTPKTDFDAKISMYAELAEVSRREGLLALESRIDAIDDEFVQNGLRMVTDGIDETVLQEELDVWIEGLEDRHAIAPSILRKLSVYAPAFGMVGTVIGLINMLGNLSSPESLGKGMALALLTTLYGSLFANLVFQPFAERLEKLHQVEMSMLALDADAIRGLHAGTHPRILVGHLESMLPPAERVGYESRTKAA